MGNINTEVVQVKAYDLLVALDISYDGTYPNVDNYGDLLYELENYQLQRYDPEYSKVYFSFVIKRRKDDKLFAGVGQRDSRGIWFGNYLGVADDYDVTLVEVSPQQTTVTVYF